MLRVFNLDKRVMSALF